MFVGEEKRGGGEMKVVGALCVISARHERSARAVSDWWAEMRALRQRCSIQSGDVASPLGYWRSLLLFLRAASKMTPAARSQSIAGSEGDWPDEPTRVPPALGGPYWLGMAYGFRSH